MTPKPVNQTCLRSKGTVREACEGRVSTTKAIWKKQVNAPQGFQVVPVFCRVCGHAIEYSSPEMGGPRAN